MVVIDDDKMIEQSKQVPLEVNVGLIIGKAQTNNTLVGFEDKDSVTLIGYGLNARVDGDGSTCMSGRVSRRRATVRSTSTVCTRHTDRTSDNPAGRLLLAGQPINDPQVNLIATRTVEAANREADRRVEAQRSRSSKSLPIRRCRRRRRCRTWSRASRSTKWAVAKAISCRVLLAPSAARRATCWRRGLGQRLGISQIGVEDSEEIGGSAFTVGQYLSPRLYLSYGVGLFEPGQVLTLRYRINDKLSLEAAQGPLNQKAGINYRIERR